ncbi:MAG TPA: Crp/Fnr family transcriptional regulator [Bryobacteraceae bacterium]|nr:Crp/Fnr family transcriptional regulator [Bryobacteraceae bacterium]
MATSQRCPVGFGSNRYDLATSFSAFPDRREVRQSQAFTPLSCPAWKSLADVAHRQLVPRRKSLANQDELRSTVVIIETGIVKLVRVESDGSEFIAGLRSNGWLIDASSLILNRPLPFAAETLTPCSVFRIPRDVFMRLLENNSALMWDVARLVCREIQAEREQQFEFRGGTAQGRLERLLSELSETASTGDPLDLLPLKRLEIAQLLSITPEHLSRLLHSVTKLAV